MKKILLTLITAAAIQVASAQTKWSIDPAHTNVKFEVEYMMVSDVDGDFKVFSGSANTKDDSFQDAVIEFTIDVNSVNTEDADRDGHLKGADFFNVAKYPSITFKSQSFKKVKDNKYTLTGDLTMKDVTKPITFEVTFGGIQKDPWGNMKAGFKATSKIVRSNFGLTWNKALEAGGFLVSDDVDITVNAILVKSK